MSHITKSSLVILSAITIFSMNTGLSQSKANKYPDPPVANSKTVFPMKLTEAEWKARLTPDQYFILREEGTERAGTGKYDHFY
jgi:peptide-methionine (R)-S-oxide reductase